MTARRAATLSLSAAVLGLMLSFSGARADEPAHPALWKIQNGSNTVYLFGSLHILPEDFQWITPTLKSAMEDSKQFVFEVSTDDEALMEQKTFIIKNGLYPRGLTLRNYLNANEFARYSSILRRAGIPGWQVEHYRPWLASVLLGLAYLHPKEFTVLEGADESLSHYAKENGKDIRYLEKVRDQLALIMTGDEHGQVLALRNLLLHLQGSRQQELDLREAWASGDPEKFSALIDSYFARRPDAREILIDRRNRAWSGTLQSLLESGGTAFVTVGAAHIGGAQGLLSLMCNQGFTIRRVGENGGTDSNACGPKA